MIPLYDPIVLKCIKKNTAMPVSHDFFTLLRGENYEGEEEPYEPDYVPGEITAEVAEFLAGEL